MKRWATTYLAIMKSAASKIVVRKLIDELLKEYVIQEANPFAAAEKDVKGGDEGGDAEGEGGGDAEKGEEDKEKKAPAKSDTALTVKFDSNAVKRYNTNTDWKADEAEVKKITKKGIEVDINGTNVLVNFDDITEHAKRFFKQKLREETEGELDAEDKKQIADLEKEMGAVASEIGSAFSAAQDEIKQQVEDMPEDKLNEYKQNINEAIGVLTVLGWILASPKLVEIITKGVSKVVKLIQKYTKTNPPQTEEEKEEWAEKIIEFTHKWHKAYIKMFYYIFKWSGFYKVTGMKDEAKRMKTAKIMFYLVVAGLAVKAGIDAIGAFKAAVAKSSLGGEFALGTFESIMASIKTAEVAEFIAAIK